VADRSGGQYGSTGGIDVSDEDLWGFGQVVAVMLLVSPFVSFFEVSYGETSNHICVIRNTLHDLIRSSLIEALLRSTGRSNNKKEDLDTRTSPNSTNAVALQIMCSTNENTAIDRSFQSIRFPRHRSTKKIDDANQYQALSTLPGIEDSTAPQDMHNAERGKNVDRDCQSDSIALPTEQSLEFYSHRWFHKLILLVYCLSLAVAGEILATFPAAGAIKELKDAGPLLIPLYAKWLAVNLGVIWIFAMIGVSTMIDDPMPRIRWITSSREKLASWKAHVRDSLNPAVAAWVSAIAWNGLILVMTAGSARLSIYFIWYI